MAASASARCGIYFRALFIFVAVDGDWWVLLTFDGIIDGHVHVQNGQIETRKKEKGQ